MRLANREMTVNFAIPDRAFRGFDELIRLGPENLGLLAAATRTAQPTLDVGRLCRDLAMKLPDGDAEKLRLAVVSVLIPLAGLRSELDPRADDFVRQVGRLISEQKPKWWKANKDGWGRMAPAVQELIAPGGLFAVQSKLGQLLMTHEAVAQEFRLLTELRPVFDDSGTELKAMLLTNTLVVNYGSEASDRQILLAMDRRDLDALREQIDRAITKVAALEAQVVKMNVPLLIAGASQP